MKISKNNSFTVVKPTNESISNFFLDFKEKYTTFIHDNIIIDFSALKGTNTENILQFLEHSKTHKNSGASFVLVVNGIDSDNLPEELIVVPTLTEAKDVVEMEEIERDLGFN